MPCLTHRSRPSSQRPSSPALPPPAAGDDPKKGTDTFTEECGDCHSTVAGKNKKGPSLFGVVGRQAGSVADFAGYSDAR